MVVVFKVDQLRRGKNIIYDYDVRISLIEKLKYCQEK
jgi:hypothetical protein